MQTGAVNKNSLGPHFRVCLRPPNLHRLFLKDATYWYRFVVGRGFVKKTKQSRLPLVGPQCVCAHWIHSAQDKNGRPVDPVIAHAV